MERQYTSRAQGCLFRSFRRLSWPTESDHGGGQEANANLAIACQERKKPKDFTEFSIDTQNLGAYYPAWVVESGRKWVQPRSYRSLKLFQEGHPQFY